MRGANTCPECRMRIDHKNIGIDLLAREIINEFEVFCPMDDCPWKVHIQNIFGRDCCRNFRNIVWLIARMGKRQTSKAKKIRERKPISWSGHK